MYPINAMGISKAITVTDPAMTRFMMTLLLKLYFMQRIARGEHAVAED